MSTDLIFMQQDAILDITLDMGRILRHPPYGQIHDPVMIRIQAASRNLQRAE